MQTVRSHPAGPSETSKPGDPAAVLLLTQDEWLCRSVAALLNGDQFSVSAVKQARSLVRLLTDRRTDAVLLDLKLRVEPGVDVESFLAEIPRDPSIPVIAIASQETSRGARLDALNAGVWDVLEFPLSPAELLAKLSTWIQLKRHLDDVNTGVLLDVATGHYSAPGIRRRLRELVALSQRTGEPLTCVAFGADPAPEGTALTPRAVSNVWKDFSLALHHQTRNSDVVGRLEPLKFAVLAPKTPPAGARKMAERLTSWSLTRCLNGDAAVTFSAGIAGIAGANGQVYARPELLLAAAARALNQSRSEGAAQVTTA